MADKDRKVAFVTGGSRGIGKAIVRKLAHDGFAVAFTYVRSADAAKAIAEEITKSGGEALALQADSADAAALTSALDKTFARFGQLDVLVNNAGMVPDGTIDDASVAVIDHVLAVNTRSVVVASQAAVRHMKRGARIVSIGSCLAERVPDPGITLYAMTKSALIGLTKGLARDYGPRGITVNLVQPGATDTDMNPADGETAPDQVAHAALGSYGRPEDVAAMVAFLVGEGGRHVTGAMLAVDGGANA